jgi:hypothetical protein
MKKVIVLFFVFICLTNSFAAFNPIEPKKILASQIMVPIGHTGKSISLLELSTINAKSLENLTGRKMKLFERMAFSGAQKKLRKNINPDGSLKPKFLKLLKRGGEDNTKGFHVIGFLLGFVLGLIGVLIAYVMNDDADKKNRVKWAWLGFLIGWVLVIGLYVLLIASTGI